MPDGRDQDARWRGVWSEASTIAEPPKERVYKRIRHCPYASGIHALPAQGRRLAHAARSSKNIIQADINTCQYLFRTTQ